MKIILEQADRVRMVYWISDDDFEARTSVEVMDKTYNYTDDVDDKGTVIYREKK